MNAHTWYPLSGDLSSSLSSSVNMNTGNNGNRVFIRAVNAVGLKSLIVRSEPVFVDLNAPTPTTISDTGNGGNGGPDSTEVDKWGHVVHANPLQLCCSWSAFGSDSGFVSPAYAWSIVDNEAATSFVVDWHSTDATQGCVNFDHAV